MDKETKPTPKPEGAVPSMATYSSANTVSSWYDFCSSESSNSARDTELFAAMLAWSMA